MLDDPGSVPPDPILKADTLARVRTPPARREEILAEFEHSGLSGARFARLHGINYQTFMAWRRKRPTAPDRMGELAARLGLREVEVGAAVPGEGTAALEIEIGGSVRLRVATARQADLAARIIGNLRGALSCQPC